MILNNLKIKNMFDPKNRLHFKNKSPRDKLYEIVKSSLFITTISDKEKDFITKCKTAKSFVTNKSLHRDLQVIYDKLLIFKQPKP